MTSPAVDSLGREIDSDALTRGPIVTSVCDQAAQSLHDEAWLNVSTTVYHARTSGSVAFMATELLRYLNAGSSVRRTVSQDLQSFYWVIVYTVFKHAAQELKSLSESAPAAINSIAGFNRGRFDEECDKLFPATSAANLVKARGTAFRKKSEADGTRGEELADAGIENLANYVYSKDSGLASLLVTVWYLLKTYEPLLPRKDDVMTPQARALFQQQTGIVLVRADAKAGGIVTSDSARDLDHDKILEVLEVGLEDIIEASR